MPRSLLSDDELSELAECLEDACQERIRQGYRIAPPNAQVDAGECCPLGALLLQPEVGMPAHPAAATVSSRTGLPWLIAASFMAGFDETCRPSSASWARKAVALGRMFREKYVSGINNGTGEQK